MAASRYLTILGGTAFYLSAAASTPEPLPPEGSVPPLPPSRNPLLTDKKATAGTGRAHNRTASHPHGGALWTPADSSRSDPRRLSVAHTTVGDSISPFLDHPRSTPPPACTASAIKSQTSSRNRTSSDSDAAFVSLSTTAHTSLLGVGAAASYCARTSSLRAEPDPGPRSEDAAIHSFSRSSFTRLRARS